MMQWTIVGVFLIAGGCLAEIAAVPPVDINKLDEVSQIKTRCEKKSPGSYDQLKLAINQTKTCLESKISPVAIKDELEEAKKTGSMDEVFAKYCKKRPEYKDCLMKTVNASKNCLEKTEITALDTAVKVIEEIAEFACFNNGDRLAMFVAEGGIGCIEERTDNIAKCINDTLKIPIDRSQGFSIDSIPKTLPSLGIDKKKCDDLTTIRQCIVNDLEENCSDTTPANIIDALFKFVNKSTCKKLKQKRSNSIWRLKRDIQNQTIYMSYFLSVSDKIAEKCKETGGKDANNELWSAFYNAQTCFGKKRIFVTPKDDYLNAIKNCTRDLVLKAEACLSEETRYYPSLFVEAVESMIEFGYDHLNFNTLSPRSEIVHCLQRIKMASDIKESFDSCLQFSYPTEGSNFSIPSKTEICKHWLKLNECFNNFVKRTCIRDITVDRLLANLTQASQKPCRNTIFD